MIDWLNLLYNSIWILALALALAVFSIAYYQAQLGKVKIGSILGKPNFALTLHVAGGLFSLGMALTSERWWEIVLWGILFLGFCYQVIILRNSRFKIED